jgi:hypothetical protein
MRLSHSTTSFMPVPPKAAVLERLRRQATRVPEKLDIDRPPAHRLGAGFNVEPIEERTSPAAALVDR